MKNSAGISGEKEAKSLATRWMIVAACVLTAGLLVAGIAAASGVFAPLGKQVSRVAAVPRDSSQQTTQSASAAATTTATTTTAQKQDGQPTDQSATGDASGSGASGQSTPTEPTYLTEARAYPFPPKNVAEAESYGATFQGYPVRFLVSTLGMPSPYDNGQFMSLKEYADNASSLPKPKSVTIQIDNYPVSTKASYNEMTQATALFATQVAEHWGYTSAHPGFEAAYSTTEKEWKSHGWGMICWVVADNVEVAVAVNTGVN